MRTIIRVGVIVGGLWFVALFALQAAVALVVLVGVIAAGICAGLAIAKWLDRAWYGKQLLAGLRAGAIASGTAGLAALVALLAMGPHDVTTLAARSHAFGLNLGAVARALGFAGYIGVDILGTLAAVALGAGLAAVMAQIFAWSKSAKAIRIVAQARLAAQVTRQDDERAPYSTGAPTLAAGQPVHAAVLLNQKATGAYAVPASTSQGNVIPFPDPLFPAASSMPRLAPDYAPPSSPTLTPPTPIAPRRPFASPEPVAPAAWSANTGEPDDTLAGLFPTGPEETPARKVSRARPVSQDLTDAMRDALAMWAEENEPSEPAARDANKSEFLNTATPAPKRGRKKSDTRDWLC